MLLLKSAVNNLKLINNVCFRFHQKRRDPSIPTQSATMLPYSINYLHDNKGAVRVAKQLGRGPGSGKGKTSGRGHKGQLARQGGHVHVRFEGGQTPISRRLPKYGRVFKKRPVEFLNYVNLVKIDYFVKRKIIDPKKPITIKTLVDCGLVKKVKFGVKVLGKGIQKIDYPLHLEVSDVSKSVIQKLTEVGGSVKLIHRTPLKLREHMYPEKYPLPLGEPITPWWKVQKLMRKQEEKGIAIEYNKPKWLQENPIVKKQSSFVYPIPRVSQPDRVRTRKPKIYKKIQFNF